MKKITKSSEEGKHKERNRVKMKNKLKYEENQLELKEDKGKEEDE